MLVKYSAAKYYRGTRMSLSDAKTLTVVIQKHHLAVENRLHGAAQSSKLRHLSTKWCCLGSLSSWLDNVKNVRKLSKWKLDDWNIACSPVNNTQPWPWPIPVPDVAAECYKVLEWRWPQMILRQYPQKLNGRPELHEKHFLLGLDALYPCNLVLLYPNGHFPHEY